MKAREIQKVNSYLSLALVCREHIAIIAMIPAMMINLKHFDKLLLEILKSAAEQALPTTQFAKEKLRVRKELSKIVTELSGIVRSYCLSVNNIIVREQFPWGYSELYRMRAFYLSCHSTNLINFLDENFNCFRDFGLKKGNLDNLKSLHKQFSELMPRPRLSRNGRAVQTKMIPERIAKIESLVKDQMLTLLPGFSQFPEFCKAFKAAHKPVKYGRPKEALKKKINKYRSSPPLPRTRKSSRPRVQLKPFKITETVLPENREPLQNEF